MKIPFVTLSKEEKGLFKGSNKGHGIRLTPYSTKRHLTIGRINTELTVITIDETSMAYVRVDREHLENEISLYCDLSLLSLLYTLKSLSTHVSLHSGHSPLRSLSTPVYLL